MQKRTWFFVGLLLGQPLLVYLLRGQLLPAVPVHFGWLPNAWNQVATQNTWVAVGESALMPLLLIATRYLPAVITMIQTPHWWLLPPLQVWRWWLFGANWFVLISLFSDFAVVNAAWQVWTGVLVIQLLAYAGYIMWLHWQKSDA
ncbi:hypothetical protein [Lactiplantibacillus fabifermentans]|uniref:Uncharacterized protein n=2 Tax=Lactiplantibacillus fabifermentans TaxID=483011 RepID=A0A0R2NRB3_9LACO|nr:hypothetical protein [Lactiplantibacillus fabifermentans]ETY74397.1 hypothetical protein LFAB_07905 [Lactiplantibacillus fabifermentans T30PCM01]KRO28257.1 hypothetical protein DY78_GL002493 [Lactiplantibacillus fabifermentans DSM 21115]